MPFFSIIIFLALLLVLIIALKAHSKLDLHKKKLLALENEIKALREKMSDETKGDENHIAPIVSVEMPLPVDIPLEEQEEIAPAKMPAPPSQMSPPIATPSKVIPPKPPREAVVFTAQNKARLVKWFVDYWTYALGGLSLALAGIYIVRLGIEKGLFPPTARILTALLFGAGLVYLAEWLRKKGGDLKSDFTAYVPSTIAAAGFATIFSAVLGAQTLYGLISVPTAFMGLIIIGLFAVVCGLRFGVLLSAFGVFGAFLGPIIVGEASPSGYMMFAYALLVLAIALYVDSLKRTGWLSVWAMIASFGFAYMVYGGRAFAQAPLIFEQAYLAFGMASVILVVMLPERKFIPDFEGVSMMTSLGDKMPWPIFPVRLIWGAVAGSVAIYFMTLMLPQGIWPSMIFVAFLGFLCFALFAKSSALTDLGFVPLGLAIVTLFFVMGAYLPDRRTEVIAICLLGLVFSLCAALGSKTYMQNRQIWQYVSLAYPLMFVAVIMPQYFQGRLDVEWPFFVAAFGLLTAFLTYHYAMREGLASLRTELGALLLWGYFVFRLLGMRLSCVRVFLI